MLDCLIGFGERTAMPMSELVTPVGYPRRATIVEVHGVVTGIAALTRFEAHRWRVGRTTAWQNCGCPAVTLSAWRSMTHIGKHTDSEGASRSAIAKSYSTSRAKRKIEVLTFLSIAG